MSGISRAIVVGTLTKTGVEVTYTAAGVPHATFVLVVNETGSDGREHPVFVDCECWGKRAEQAGECEAGQLCLFEGHLAKRKRGEQWEMVVSGYALLPVGVQPQTTLTGTPQ
jgi:single-stranded DNA-binding protein